MGGSQSPAQERDDVKVRILAGAYRELSRGFDFYESREKGLGHDFRETLIDEIDELRLTAGIHPVRFNGYHMKLSRRFPYAIYYRIDGDVAVVRAVIDCRINPDRAGRRLK